MRKHVAAGSAASALAIASALALALGLGLGVSGCSVDSAPTAPRWESPSELTVIEGDPDWLSESVSWADSATGSGRFAFIAVRRFAGLGGPSHYLYSAPFHVLGCPHGDCLPQTRTLFANSGLSIFSVDWSPAGALLAFEGRTEGESETWIYTLQPEGTPRKWIAGFDPSFTRNGGLVVYVDHGREAISAFNPSSGGNFPEWSGLEGAAHPRVSPDGRLLAYSARDGRRGRRIWVHDRQDPTSFADPVSWPDHLPTSNQGGDGTDDDFPTWSPRGGLIAYRATVRENTLRDAIYLTDPRGEPENPVRILATEPGQRISALRWHPNGRTLLLVMDGDICAFPVPERYWSR